MIVLMNMYNYPVCCLLTIKPVFFSNKGVKNQKGLHRKAAASIEPVVRQAEYQPGYREENNRMYKACSFHLF